MSNGKDRYELVKQSEISPMLHSLRLVLGKLNKYLNEHDRDRTFRRQYVGSFNRGVVTRIRDGNKGWDIDVNLVMTDVDDYGFDAPSTHRSYLNGLREAIKGSEFNRIEASTSVFTIKRVDKKTSRVIYSVDLAVVYYDSEGDLHYLQYYKGNGYTQDGYGFQVRRLCRPLDEMLDFIYDNSEDPESLIAESYLKVKNSNYDQNKRSFILYIETINNLYCQMNPHTESVCIFLGNNYNRLTQGVFDVRSSFWY